MPQCCLLCRRCALCFWTATLQAHHLFKALGVGTLPIMLLVGLMTAFSVVFAFKGAYMENSDGASLLFNMSFYAPPELRFERLQISSELRAVRTAADTPVRFHIAFPPDTDTPGLARENETKPWETSHVWPEMFNETFPATHPFPARALVLCMSGRLAVDSVSGTADRRSVSETPPHMLAL